MEKDFLDKANDLYSTVEFWQSRVNDFKKVIAHPNYYDVQFREAHSTVWLETNMNYELNVVFAKQCLEYAEKKLAEAQKAFAEL